jgi:hypothetical protein
MPKSREAYVDTSAFIAFMDASDWHHPLFARLFADPPPLVTTPQNPDDHDRDLLRHQAGVARHVLLRSDAGGGGRFGEMEPRVYEPRTAPALRTGSPKKRHSRRGRQGFRVPSVPDQETAHAAHEPLIGSQPVADVPLAGLSLPRQPRSTSAGIMTLPSFTSGRSSGGISSLGGILCLTLGLSAAAAVAGEITVTADFENGSAEVIGIDQETGTIRIRAAGDPVRGWPCWWSFKVSGITPKRTLCVEIVPSTSRMPGGTNASEEGQPLLPEWSWPDQATVSFDDGRTWSHTPGGEARNGCRCYTLTAPATQAWFAWGPVFSVGTAGNLIDRLADDGQGVIRRELARTRGGRSVPAVMIRAGDADDRDRRGLWIQARQHAWESGSSWVVAGFLEWLTGEDPQAVALRGSTLVHVVPIMDVDSVAEGNGGKEQRPQDHNRDWSTNPHFPEVVAAQRTIAGLDARGGFDLFVDIHNPGARDNQPFFHVAPDDALSDVGRRNLERLVTATTEEMRGPLVFNPLLRPTAARYSPRWREMSHVWIAEHCRPHVVAVCLETPWNTPHSTTEGYRTVGRQLGLAIERFLRDAPRAAEGED